MTPPARWEDAPCGLLTLRPDGTVGEANGTVLEWLGRTERDVLGCQLSELLSVGGRIYWETHLSPLLHVDGRVDEVAVELRAAGGRLPVLLTAVRSGDGVHVALSSARERSRYERELLSARAAADRSATQLRALQEVTAALSQALGVEGVAQALLAAAVAPLGAAAGTLWLSDRETGLIRHSSRGEPAGACELPAPALLQRTAVVTDGGRAVVPLRGHSVLQGVLSLLPPDTAAAESPDLEMLTTVGQQAGLALDRAQLYEQSAMVAHELQHSLLAVEPPRDGRFAVATAYRPGVEMLEVGGDWYDVFAAEPDVLSVVVGDVVGRGLHAASTMGQLRSAVRAVAASEVGPARLLSRLDRFVDQVEAAAMATVAYAELDLDEGRLRYACAGHPPPLLLPVAGRPRLLWEGRSTPLGAFAPAQHRAEATVQLTPGDRVLLYTDGLFERRDRDLDDGLAVLERVTAELHSVPLAEAVARLTQTLLLDERVRDDVCVLMLSWAGRPFHRTLPADLTGLSAIRQELAAWLAERGLDGQTADDLVLAASEAMANAAEHGSGRRSEESVALSAELEQRPDHQDQVVVTVRDRGRWRTGPASHERGRGLMIMRALVDVAVQEGDGTTVVLRRTLPREPS
ncbi:MAG: SpoIIE family protein phosphatase [Mycobacteriales bacterium]